MANETDFFDLYDTLGLGPDCSLPEFKRAYRRHVALLHPDRLADAHRHSPDMDTLRKLIAQYSAAMEFQRRHGRLPGATVPTRPASAEPVARARAPRPRDDPRQPYAMPLVLLGVLAVSALLWSALMPVPAIAPESTAAVRPQHVVRSAVTSTVTSTAKPLLSIGMSQDEVRAIEGEPIDVLDDRWEYGPSWVRFEHGKVIDWYSSPLRSLQTAGNRP